MKQRLKRMWAVLLCVTCLIPNFQVYADEVESVAVIASIASTYNINIPKAIKLNPTTKSADFTVSVTGDLAVGGELTIVNDESFKMSTTDKEDVTATVFMDKTIWNLYDMYDASGTITASGLTAGNWMGIFNFNINLTEEEPQYNEFSVTDRELSMAGIATYGDIVIPEIFAYDGTIYKITSIGDGAFYNCGDITSIVLPNSITNIAQWAFDGCVNLNSINIPDSVNYIGDYAFSRCDNLFSIVIPNNVTHIGSYALSCLGLRSVMWKGTEYNSPTLFNQALKDAGVAVDDVW